MLNVHCHCLIDPDRAGTNRHFFTISQRSQLQFNRNIESSDCISHLGYVEIDILFALEQMFFLGETAVLLKGHEVMTFFLIKHLE